MISALGIPGYILLGFILGMFVGLFGSFARAVCLALTPRASTDVWNLTKMDNNE